MYMTVKQAAEKWGISDRRVKMLLYATRGTASKYQQFPL